MNTDINIETYGFTRDLLPEGTDGTVARITAVYKDRFEIVSAHGNGYARLKKDPIMPEMNLFPLQGILSFFPGRTMATALFIKRFTAAPFFPAWIHLLQVTRNRQLLLTLTMYLSCSH